MANEERTKLFESSILLTEVRKRVTDLIKTLPDIDPATDLGKSLIARYEDLLTEVYVTSMGQRRAGQRFTLSDDRITQVKQIIVNIFMGCVRTYPKNKTVPSDESDLKWQTGIVHSKDVPVLITYFGLIDGVKKSFEQTAQTLHLSSYNTVRYSIMRGGRTLRHPYNELQIQPLRKPG